MGEKEIFEMIDLTEIVCGSAAMFWLRKFKTACYELGIPLKQGHLLLMLLRSEKNFSQNDVCKLMELDPPKISRMIDEIEKTGLVRRATPEDNRREHIVVLTDTGQAKAAELWERTREIYAELLGFLDKEEQGMLKRILEKIGENVKK